MKKPIHWRTRKRIVRVTWHRAVRHYQLPIDRFVELALTRLHYTKSSYKPPIFPWKIRVLPEHRKNPWIEDASFLGINSMRLDGRRPNLRLFVDPNPGTLKWECSQCGARQEVIDEINEVPPMCECGGTMDRLDPEVPLLWLLLHEFRHHMQLIDRTIGAAVLNGNTDQLIRALCQNRSRYPQVVNAVKHVFHETIPYEVDANVFACELLRLPYRPNKWAITEHTLGWLAKEFSQAGFARQKARRIG